MAENGKIKEIFIHPDDKSGFVASLKKILDTVPLEGKPLHDDWDYLVIRTAYTPSILTHLKGYATIESPASDDTDDS